MDFALAAIYGGNCHGEDDDNPLELGVPYCQTNAIIQCYWDFWPEVRMSHTQSNQGISEHPTINLYCRQCVPPPTCIMHPQNIPAVFWKCLPSSMCSGREDMEIMRKWESIYSRGLPTFSIAGLLSIDTQLGFAIGFVLKRAWKQCHSNGKNHDSPILRQTHTHII